MQPQVSHLGSISVTDLAERLANPVEQLQLIDVREPEELAIARIPGFLVLPLSEFSDWSGQLATRLDPHQETLVLCHHGVRSAQFGEWLLHQGFTNVKNIVGGIDAYACQVDPQMARY